MTRGVVASAFAGSLNQSPSPFSQSHFDAFCVTRMPCLEVEYISHCGWSKPMWQVAQASGRRASAAEKVWRVWQESHRLRSHAAVPQDEGRGPR